VNGGRANVKHIIRVSVLIFSLIILSPIVYAENLKITDTSGSIGFTGKYESENTPMPLPPNFADDSMLESSITDRGSGKSLPKMNTIIENKLFFVGKVFLTTVGILILKKRKEEHINEKDSISNNDVFNDNTFN